MFTDYLASPTAVILLALIAAVISGIRGQWEYVPPRLVLVAVYGFVMLVPNMPEEIRRFLVRWSIVLLLFVEILSYGIRKFFTRKGA